MNNAEIEVLKPCHNTPERPKRQCLTSKPSRNSPKENNIKRKAFCESVVPRPETSAINGDETNDKKRRVTGVPIHDFPNGPWTKQLKSLPIQFNISQVVTFFTKNKANKHLEDGNRMQKAKKVGSVFICDPGSDKAFIFVKSIIVPSYKLYKKYAVQLKLEKISGDILDGYCECPCGNGGVCKHTCAVLWFLWECKLEKLFYIPHDKSCTEVPKKWGLKKGNANLQTKSFSNLQFKKHKPNYSNENPAPVLPKPKYSSLPVLDTEEKRKADEMDLEARIERVSNSFGKGAKAMWQEILAENNYLPVPEETHDEIESNESLQQQQVPTITPEIPFPEIPKCQKDKIFPSECVLTLIQARNLESLTRGQSNSQLWKSERVKRITASKFGDVIKRKKEITPKYVETIRKGSDLSGNVFVQEGITNEGNAINMYKVYKAGTVICFNVGFCVNPSLPIIGASPDQICYDKSKEEFGLLEIKTLAKAKKEGYTVSQAIDKKLAPCLKKDKNGEISLKENHNYYFQVQGQLGVTGYKWCDFFLVTGNDYFCQRINFNCDIFNDLMVPKLSEFYFSHF